MRRDKRRGSPLNNKVWGPIFVNRNRPTFAVPHKGANLWMNFLGLIPTGCGFSVAKQLLIDEPPVAAVPHIRGIPTG